MLCPCLLLPHVVNVESSRFFETALQFFVFFRLFCHSIDANSIL